MGRFGNYPSLGAVTACVVSGITCFVLGVVCPVFHSARTVMPFRYGDRVVITRGFMQGNTGRLIDRCVFSDCVKFRVQFDDEELAKRVSHDQVDENDLLLLSGWANGQPGEGWASQKTK